MTLGKGAVLRNFGGMSAVRATDQAKIVMESGSVIEDNLPGYTRAKDSATGSVGPAGAIWLQGGTLVMEEGSKIQNVNGRGVYADGGKVEIGGAISGIAANESAIMWQANSGIAIHLRNKAEGTLTSTALIKKLSGGSVIHCADGAESFEMENGSKITDCPSLNGNVIFAKNSIVVIDGEISNVHATGNHILQTGGGGTAVTIGENGRILNNRAFYGVVYINGTDEHLDIYGKINGNICTSRGGGVVLANNGGNNNATMYEGAEICNNKAEKTGGGTMISKGTFTMNGGTISGNISGTGSAKDEADLSGGGVFVRKGGQFIMNGGAIENNATTAFGGGVCFDASDYSGTVPKIELNAGTIKNNLRQVTVTVTVNDEYQITGGRSNDLAVTGKDYGKCDRYLYISREAAVGDKAVYFQTGSKTVTPDDSSFDIRLGNTSDANVTALTDASKSMGWNNKPLATFWVQRDGAAALTIGGLTLNAPPFYVLTLPVDETGKVLDASEPQVYEAQKTDTGDIDITLPDVSGNGYAVAVVQPSQNHGTLIINGPETIEKNKTGADYPVTYTVTYAMSESMEGIIKQSVGKAKYVLTIDHDTRLVLVGNPDSFNGKSIQVTYSLPRSKFKAGDFLLASAKLKITVGEHDYIIPSNVTKTQEVETTYSLTTQVNGGHGGISESKAGRPAGSHETVVFTPDSGYKIDTVTVNGVKAEVRSNKLEVIMDADKTVIVTYKGSTVKPSDQPDKSGKTASSNTGDSSNPVLWSALLFISGGAVIGTTVVSRKKKYNR